MSLEGVVHFAHMALREWCSDSAKLDWVSAFEIDRFAVAQLEFDQRIVAAESAFGSERKEMGWRALNKFKKELGGLENDYQTAKQLNDASSFLAEIKEQYALF